MNDKTLQLSGKRLNCWLLFLFFVLENQSFEDERRKKKRNTKYAHAYEQYAHTFRSLVYLNKQFISDCTCECY